MRRKGYWLGLLTAFVMTVLFALPGSVMADVLNNNSENRLFDFGTVSYYVDMNDAAILDNGGWEALEKEVFFTRYDEENETTFPVDMPDGSYQWDETNGTIEVYGSVLSGSDVWEPDIEIQVNLKLSKDNNEIITSNCTFWMQNGGFKPGSDYTSIYTGSAFDIGRECGGTLYDADHPLGEWVNSSITSLSIQLGDDAVAVEKYQVDNDNDGEAEDWYWTVTGISEGTAVLSAVYLYEGIEYTYDYTVVVNDENFNCSITPETGSVNVLPGHSLSISADVIRQSAAGEEPAEGLFYKWEIGECDQTYAELVTDTADPSKAVVYAKELPEGSEAQTVYINVYVYKDEQMSDSIAAASININITN